LFKTVEPFKILPIIVVFTPGGADKLESAERILNKEKSYNKIPQPRVNVLKLFTVVSSIFMIN